MCKNSPPLRGSCLDKNPLEFVFLGVYTVGFFGKTFLKHETWDCRGEAEVWQRHQSPRRHGVSLARVTFLALPQAAAIPLGDPCLPEEQDAAAKPGGPPSSVQLLRGKGQVQRPLGLKTGGGSDHEWHPSSTAWLDHARHSSEASLAAFLLQMGAPLFALSF